MKAKPTEQDLAKVLISDLSEWGWEIYQEVQGPGGRCDIVAVRGKMQWAIECKLTFGFSVIEQAYNWKRYNRGHYVSIAVPYRSLPGTSQLAYDLLKRAGIGLLGVRCFGSKEEGETSESLSPRLNRHAKGFTLYEEQKTFCEAGGNQGGHWTPFKSTVRALVNAVRKKPGIEFNDLIKTLDHHYSSLSTAKSCLRKYIGRSVIPELRCELVGRKLCVFLAEGERHA